MLAFVYPAQPRALFNPCFNSRIRHPRRRCGIWLIGRLLKQQARPVAQYVALAANKPEPVL